ncbi:MAG TPA: gliding motility-associated peptidyl-prolyl isomerase GldI [Flavobacteriales bacterium]|jgi:gliding motility-associated peptidyl-prolyl isomerase|nr:gliding motility-associated peptidyl-prolyl isomerase GldI [Flavobacteriales bacterium]
MNPKLVILLGLVLTLTSCKNNKQSVRAPIPHRKPSVDMESVRQNRDLNSREEAYIKQMIQTDSLHQYINSGHGFWYYYLHQNNQGKTIEPNDKVLLNYEIKDLSDNVIYSANEIGERWYWVDHENQFRGFREAVKLLKEGETAEFLFPSNAAYGFHGDENRIGTNIPLKVKIKIIKLNKQKTN